ncbi:MAG: transposase family protein [Actinomycetia bacterium]|nr:transposase family protein [Actinomycetes bacterium]
MGAENLCHLAGCSAEQWALQHPDPSIMALTASRPLGESPAILTAWKAAHRSASGHQGGYEMREIVNAILYQSRTGCQREYLPHDLPPRSAALLLLRQMAR